MQYNRAFFNPTSDPAYDNLGIRPSDNEIKAWLDGDKCPLTKVVVSKRNEPAMDQLKTYAFNAMIRHDHSCKGMNFGFYCGPGQGKTHTIKAFAATIGIPLVFIQSDALESTWMLFELITKAHEESGWPLVPLGDGYSFTVPPCLVWFDEAQALSQALRTGGLLNAMEANDGWLRTQPPGKNQRQHVIDCQNICWIASSTDPGDIYAQSSAFYDRLSDHVIWHPAGPKEIALIVKRNHPQIPEDACHLVAHYMKIPRKAIAFANQMILQKTMHGYNWEDAAKRVAEIQAIDEHGMPQKELRVLTILGQGPVSQANLPKMIGARKAEVDSMLLPPLLDDQEGRGQLVRPTTKGFTITKAGLKELDTRKIPHKGMSITAEHIMGL